jgi:hemolysin activation/secretion protein
MKKVLPFLLAFSLPLCAQDVAVSLPKPKKVKPVEQNQEEATIRSIVLIGRNGKLLSTSQLKRMNGLELIGVDLPSGKTKLKELLRCFLDNETAFTKQNIRKIKEQLYAYYREYDHPFVMISVPNQFPKTGALQMVILESKLGKVEIQGNQWSTPAQYNKYFSIKPGQSISQKQLISDLNFINRNPYRHVSVAYSPGKELYTTDLTLEVSDRKPYFFYAGFDNEGIPTTNRQRVFAGVSWDQVFGYDQSIFYQYTTNYHAQRFHSNSLQYTVMLPWKAIFNLFGGYSVVRADLPFISTNKGTNFQGSFRYITPFTTNSFLSHELVFGFDLKNTNNTVEFVDIAPVFGQTVNLTQWLLGYSCRYEKNRFQVDGGVDVYFSPFEWLPNQSVAAFQSLRPEAKNKWFYGVGYVNMNYPLPHKCNLYFSTKIEGSSAPLLPSEQLGLGGYGSVRGYDVRQYSVDNGFVSTLELQSPRFPIFPTKQKNLYNSAYFLLFLDGGYGFDETKIPYIPWSNYLVGTGVGFRYRFGTYFSARFDYGFKLHNQADFTGGGSMNHFSVTGSY